MIEDPGHARVVTWNVCTNPILERKLENPGLIFDHLDRPFCVPVAGGLSRAGRLGNSNHGTLGICSGFPGLGIGLFGDCLFFGLSGSGVDTSSGFTFASLAASRSISLMAASLPDL